MDKFGDTKSSNSTDGQLLQRKTTPNCVDRALRRLQVLFGMGRATDLPLNSHGHATQISTLLGHKLNYR